MNDVKGSNYGIYAVHTDDIIRKGETFTIDVSPLWSETTRQQFIDLLPLKEKQNDNR